MRVTRMEAIRIISTQREESRSFQTVPEMAEKEKDITFDKATSELQVFQHGPGIKREYLGLFLRCGYQYTAPASLPTLPGRLRSQLQHSVSTSRFRAPQSLCVIIDGGG
jgi:hypothetical protein